MDRGWARGEVYTGFWWGNLGERDHFGHPGLNGGEGGGGGNIVFWKCGVGVWTGWSWLSIGIGGGNL
jgi:hypothetical protein